VGTATRSFATVGGKGLAPSRMIVKGVRTLQGADSELLPDALELASKLKGSDVGSPIVDDDGHVLGIIANACVPVADQPCRAAPYGVPVSAIKAFLRTAPRDAVAPAPWLGIQGVADESGPARGVRVLGVHPRSPAAAAGLRGGRHASSADTVVAIDGAPVTSPEALSKAIGGKAVGDAVRVLVFGDGKYREVSLQLRAQPTERDAGRRVRPARRARPDPGY
jgi:serine protease Do